LHLFYKSCRHWSLTLLLFARIANSAFNSLNIAGFPGKKINYHTFRPKVNPILKENKK